MEKLRRWLGIAQLCEIAKQQAEATLKNAELLADAMQRIQDLEDAYPGYKQAKADAEKQEQSEIAPGFVPFSQRKRQFEASRRRPDKK